MTKIGALKYHRFTWLFQRILLLLALVLIWAILAKSRQKTYSPSVNLVVASTLAQDHLWTSSIQIPNLKVIPFIADDPTATFHPPLNKGHEAMMYLTYIYEFYDYLPEISIFVHGDDKSWHVDDVFESSTAYTLNHLDLNEVLQRRYLNLHADWRHACPAWINTTSTSDENESKFEQPFMKKAFADNFPGEPVPEILAQPCCSQFAVTKEAIRSVPREQYRHQINWLTRSSLDDGLTGRVWEHMWQFLFLKKAVYCPSEYKALCRGWHICFESQDELDRWKVLARYREDHHPTLGRIDLSKAKIEALDLELSTWKGEAISRGLSKVQREWIAGDLGETGLDQNTDE